MVGTWLIHQWCKSGEVQMVFKKKTYMDGNFHINKALAITKGFS
jgi:hypothetical protein